jgi:hypothetical protein
MMPYKNGAVVQERQGANSPGNGNGVGAQPLNTVSDGAAPHASASPATAGRDAAGKFATGNKCGRGNPHARRMAALRGAMLETITGERLKTLAEQLYKMAVSGDTAAAGLLLSYALGKPGKCPDADALDLHEWQLVQEAPTKAEILRAMLDDVPPELAAAALLFWHESVASADPLDLLQKIKAGCDVRTLRDEIKAKRQRRK